MKNQISRNRGTLLELCQMLRHSTLCQKDIFVIHLTSTSIFSRPLSHPHDIKKTTANQNRQQQPSSVSLTPLMHHALSSVQNRHIRPLICAIDLSITPWLRSASRYSSRQLARSKSINPRRFLLPPLTIWWTYIIPESHKNWFEAKKPYRIAFRTVIRWALSSNTALLLLYHSATYCIAETIAIYKIVVVILSLFCYFVIYWASFCISLPVIH